MKLSRSNRGELQFDLGQGQIYVTRRHSVADEEGSVVDDPKELRKLAEWYRAFAKVGSADRRADRLKMAEYLDRKANALEQHAKNAALSSRYTLPCESIS